MSFATRTSTDSSPIIQSLSRKLTLALIAANIKLNIPELEHEMAHSDEILTTIIADVRECCPGVSHAFDSGLSGVIQTTYPARDS